ncbi:hypothetical protein D3C75_657200 [compost metagenome]
MKLGSDSAQVAAYLEAGDIRPFADHSYSHDPTLASDSKIIDHLLRFWGLVGNHGTRLAHVLQGPCNLLGMRDVGSDNKTRSIGGLIANLVQLLAP